MIKTGDKVIYIPLNRWDETIRGIVIFDYGNDRLLVKTTKGDTIPFHRHNLKKD